MYSEIWRLQSQIISIVEFFTEIFRFEDRDDFGNEI